jgi:uncharacterized protein (DUF1015 family)
MQTKPFSALRPIAAKAPFVAAVPYDVVDTAEARALAAGNPDSLLHVSRPEIDLPDGVDIHDDRVYAQGLAAFQALQARGVLLREPAECCYVYRQTMGAHSQTGVVLCCHVDDYEHDVIRKHERTRRDKEDDRTRHTLTLGANTGPVFLTYREQAPIDALVAGIVKGAPLYDFTSADGIRHTVWRVARRTADWTARFEQVPLAYVADGHHRAAAAARAARVRREANPGHTGTEEYNWFLAVLFPSSHLRVLPYNRCVSDLNGLTPEDFLNQVAQVFELTPELNPVPCGPRQVHMYLAGRWYRLRWPDFAADPVNRLDVSVLQQRLLEPVLGIDDPRTSPRIHFVGGIRGTDELARRVDAGEDAVAFSMHPVTVTQVMDIADAGQIMPPKSTWFEPKLRSGLLIHTLD